MYAKCHLSFGGLFVDESEGRRGMVDSAVTTMFVCMIGMKCV
jgi:hypothetical protein